MKYIEYFPSDKILHRSNPMFRNKILLEGLIVKGKSEAWLSDTAIDKPCIFASDTLNINELFDSGYDDDIYEIDLRNLKNKWFKDPNFIYFKNSVHIITFENIPRKYIKLIYKGTGESLD